MSLPTNFTDLQQIRPDKVKPNAQTALSELNEKGFQVFTGLTPELAADVLIMSKEPAIREYCPKDSSERFSDQAAVQDWLSKGRAFFSLQRDGQLIGYGWTGQATSSHVSGGQTTFALRIGEAGHGQGLATPFSWVTISA